MAGREVNHRRDAVRTRAARTLRLRLLIGLLVLALPLIASPFAHLSSRRLAFAWGGETFVALAGVAGVFAMLPGRTAKQGLAWVGCAVALVAAGYGFVALSLS